MFEVREELKKSRSMAPARQVAPGEGGVEGGGGDGGGEGGGEGGGGGGEEGGGDRGGGGWIGKYSCSSWHVSSGGLRSCCIA